MTDWKPGDVANGHVLGDDLVWRPTGETASLPSYNESVAAQSWKPGDLANGHVLGDDLVWRPLDSQAAASAEWANTAMPLNKGKISKEAAQAIRRQSFDRDPWLVLAPGFGQGLIAAWEDRLSVIKTGLLTGFMAGSYGGERTGTFHFTDITGIEYNSGLMNGVLEILTGLLKVHQTG